MSKVFWLKLLVGLTAGSLSAGTIEYGVISLGGNSYQYNYVLSGITFQANEALDIRFNPVFYSSLSNGVAPSGFDVILLQPNNPPGVFGDFDVFAQTNNPSTTGVFSVQFTFSGLGLPGDQPFFMNQFDSNGVFLSRIDGGFTVDPPDLNATPEPSSLALISGTLLLGGLWTMRARLRPHRSE